MKLDITDREMDIMNVIWEREKVSAQEIAAYFLEPMQGGYNKNTTYTFLKRLIEKGAIKRIDPGFFCVAICSREEVQYEKTKSFVEKVYQGSFRQLFVQFAQSEKLGKQEIDELKKILEESQV